MTIRYFAKHFKLAILTKGFEQWTEGDNLIITIGFIGKATNDINHRFKVQTDEVVQVFASKGIKMIKPYRLYPKDLAGQEWPIHLLKNSSNQLLQPQDSVMYKGFDGLEYMRFKDYFSTPAPLESDMLSEESEADRQTRSVPINYRNILYCEKIVKKAEEFTDLKDAEWDDEILLYPVELGLTNMDLPDIEEEMFQQEKSTMIKN